MFLNGDGVDRLERERVVWSGEDGGEDIIRFLSSLLFYLLHIILFGRLGRSEELYIYVVLCHFTNGCDLGEIKVENNKTGKIIMPFSVFNNFFTNSFMYYIIIFIFYLRSSIH